MSTRHDWNEPNLGPTDVKRQHYVPQALLRGFMGADGMLRVVDLDNGEDYRTGTANTAVESGFNDVVIEGVRLSTEGWLADIEDEAMPILRSLADEPDRILSLSGQQEIALARFLTAQRLRTPAFRYWLAGVDDMFVPKIKEMAKAQLFAQMPQRQAEELWVEWDGKPSHFWRRQEEPDRPEDTAAWFLGEVQGFANILRAAPWRIGRTAGALRLYTSDNPVSAYLPAVRFWWEGAAFGSMVYFFALAPDVLLKVERRRVVEGSEPAEFVGPRRRLDYSDWEVSFARHIITIDSTRFLYGEGLIVPRDCASACVRHHDQANVAHARTYQGFDPSPPTVLPLT